MRWSSLFITTALSLFVIFGLINAIKAQRGSIRFGQQSSSAKPWVDDSSTLAAREGSVSQNERPSPRRRVATTETVALSEKPLSRTPTRSRNRPTSLAAIQSRSQDVSKEDEGSQNVSKEQLAPSLRTEVIYQNEFSEDSSKSSKEKTPFRRKNRPKGLKNVSLEGNNSTSTTATSVRPARKFTRTNSAAGSKLSNEVEEITPKSGVTRQRNSKSEKFEVANNTTTTTSTTETSTASSTRSIRKLNRLTSSVSNKISNDVEETISSSSVRSVDNRLRGKVKAVSKERVESLSSEENYPEQFKKLLKAKHHENNLKDIYANTLDVTTVKSYTKAEEKSDVSRSKVRVLSTTTPGSTTTVKVITPRPIRTLVSSSTIAEPSSLARQASSRSRAVSTTPSPSKTTKRTLPLRSRTATFSSSSTSTESSSTTTATAATSKSSRGFSRKPSVVSLLTSSTTPSSTTSRKSYSPANKSFGSSKKTSSSASESSVNNEELEPSTQKPAISSLRSPGSFRPPKKLRKVVGTTDQNNDLQSAPNQVRSKAPSPLNALKRSQSSVSRVGPRFESSLKKTPVYTPTIPTLTSTQSTAPGAGWDWAVTEPAGLFNRLPPTNTADRHHQPSPQPGRGGWSSLAVVPKPSSSTSATTTTTTTTSTAAAAVAHYYLHHSPASASYYLTSTTSQDAMVSMSPKMRTTKGNRQADSKMAKDDMKHRRVLATGNSLAFDDDDEVVDVYDSASYGSTRVKVRERSGRKKHHQQQHQQQQDQPQKHLRRGDRKFTDGLWNDLDYHALL